MAKSARGETSAISAAYLSTFVDNVSRTARSCNRVSGTIYTELDMDGGQMLHRPGDKEEDSVANWTGPCRFPPSYRTIA